MASPARGLAPALIRVHKPFGQTPPPKADAIHRALLCGLIGNVGNRTEGREYTGVRGAKFGIFPGSSLFKSGPAWLMAAELVETTRLYARTVSAVRPEWIERAAAHLLGRSYSEPHWHRESGKVVATEKVTLYGLVLVPARWVNYGAIDPRTSRETFIRHALVRGEMRSTGSFLLHNAEQLRLVKTMEAKLRRRDLLADEKERFAVFNGLVPGFIHSAALFEPWRIEAERENPRLLFLESRDLLAPGAVEPLDTQFPDSMLVNGVVIALTYVFDAADPADGVTATIPLEALGQLPPSDFEWLTPGRLAEKSLELIRSLPKELRKQFIPAAEIAAEAARVLPFGRGSLYKALALFLGRKAGYPVPPEAFDLAALPPHLLMNFRVIDAAGKPVASGRDLQTLRTQFRVRIQEQWESAEPIGPFHRDQIERWDFGPLPERVQIYRRGLTLWAYPALVERAGVGAKGPSVSLRLFDSAEAADRVHRAGIRRLFMMQVCKELNDLTRHLPKLDQVVMDLSILGDSRSLINDLMTAAADHALFFDGALPSIRTQAAFASVAEAAWRRLSSSVHDIATIAAEALGAWQLTQKELSAATAPAWIAVADDVRTQMDHLVYRGFLTSTPYHWLVHLPRFIRGAAIRLKKLRSAGSTRDAANAQLLSPLMDRYQQRRAEVQIEGQGDAVVEEIRWLLEELRVSLFAQELKTSVPISVTRVERMLNERPNGT